MTSARPRSRSAASTSGPTAEAASKVLDESKPAAGATDTNIIIDVNRTTTAAGVYPIDLVSYQIICSTYDSQDKVDLVKGFASYVISEDGQNAAAEAAGSAPITDSIREQAQAAIDQIAAVVLTHYPWAARIRGCGQPTGSSSARPEGKHG